MAERGIKLSPTGWLSLIVAAIALTAISVLFNIPVLRPAFGFIFLTFVPGFLLLFILKLNKLGRVEKLVLSAGLSLTFLMLFGLLVNGLLPAAGYARPLSTVPLVISFGLMTMALAVMAFMRNKDTIFSFLQLHLNNGEKAWLIVPSLLPLLSMVGMRFMNQTDNNALLLLLLSVIAAYVIFVSFFNRRISSNVYPLAIFFIGVSLLLMYSLRSNHIIGSDTHRELFIFQTTLINHYWSQLGFGILDACLSISLLPAIYQNFLNISPEFLVKLLPSFIISIVPLAVFLTSRKYIGGFYAFLASVLFMSQIYFLSTPSFSRTNIAIFIFSLVVLVMFHDGISELNKKVLFLIFTAAIVVSHYGVTYISFFALLFTWIGVQLLFSLASRRKKFAAISTGNKAADGSPPEPSSRVESLSGQPHIRQGANITITAIVIFLVMLFFWYSQMTGPSFALGVRFVYRSFTGLEWFVSEGTGDYVVQSALGQTLSTSGVAPVIEFVFSWLTVILLSFGLLATLWRFKGLIFRRRAVPDKPAFWINEFEVDYLVLALGCYLLLVASVVLPNISKGYGAARVYFQMMAPLSIFFVIGSLEVSMYLKSRPYWLILLVLIPYFLCTTGVVPQMFDYPRAITLNSKGPLYEMYVSDGESYAAQWLGKYGEKAAAVYARDFALEMLLSQGDITRRGMPGARAYQFSGEEEMAGYVYLRSSDMADGGLLTEYPGVFAEKNRIYANSKAEVYR